MTTWPAESYAAAYEELTRRKAKEQKLADLLVSQWRWCDEHESAGHDVTEQEAATVETLQKWCIAYDAVQEAERGVAVRETDGRGAEPGNGRAIADDLGPSDAATGSPRRTGKLAGPPAVMAESQPGLQGLGDRE